MSEETDVAIMFEGIEAPRLSSLPKPDPKPWLGAVGHWVFMRVFDEIEVDISMDEVLADLGYGRR